MWDPIIIIIIIIQVIVLGRYEFYYLLVAKGQDYKIFQIITLHYVSTPSHISSSALSSINLCDFTALKTPCYEMHLKCNSFSEHG
jgi:hypothetical protein